MKRLAFATLILASLGLAPARADETAVQNKLSVVPAVQTDRNDASVTPVWYGRWGYRPYYGGYYGYRPYAYSYGYRPYYSYYRPYYNSYYGYGYRPYSAYRPFYGGYNYGYYNNLYWPNTYSYLW
jgi:hypothetical protein